jgi:hypothetical protein
MALSASATTNLRRLVGWLAEVDPETAGRIHRAYNGQSFSDLERSEYLASRGQSNLDTTAVRKWLGRVGEAVQTAAKNDPRDGWKPEWPIVGAAADSAVWGIISPDRLGAELLTSPVCSAGFRLAADI